MSRTIDWKYVGTDGSPDVIRLNGANVHKGATFPLPEDYDWTREHGSDVRLALKIERASPPLDALTPLAADPDALALWQKEAEKNKRRFRNVGASQ